MVKRAPLGILLLALMVMATAAVAPKFFGDSPSVFDEADVASAPVPVVNETVQPPAAPVDVTLAFAGDVHFERRVANLLKPDNDALMALQETLGQADFSMLNLETAITSRGKAIPGKKYTFRAPPIALTKLADAGVDAVSLANNHAADFGAVGLADTLAAKANSPIPMVGIGANEKEAFAPATVEVQGVKLAVFGSSQLLEETSRFYSAGPAKAGIATNYKTDRLVAAIKAAQRTHDVTVVMLHWGTERMVCPDQRQLRVVKDLVNAKTDIVVGAHAHRQQGSGWLQNTFVSYGLGNFIWYRTDEPSSQTGVLTVTLDGQKVQDRAAGAKVGSVVKAQEWQPMLIGWDGIPTAQNAATTKRLHGVRAKAMNCSKLAQVAPGS